MRKKTKPEYNTFWCDTCKGIEVGGPADIKAHLLKAHAVANLKGTREAVMHLDGDTWFSWSYNWTIGKVKLHQETRQNRSKSDMMWREP